MVIKEAFADIVDMTGLNILVDPYMQSLAIMLLSFIMGIAILPFLSIFIKKLTEKTETEIDDKLFAQTKKPFFCLILILGTWIAMRHVNMMDWVLNLLETAMIISLMIIIVRVVNIVIEYWGYEFTKKTESKVDDMLIPMFHNAIIIIFFIATFLWVLGVWSVNVTPYLAGLGISGMIFGLALQDSLKNIFGGVTLILDKTFEVGDKVKLSGGVVGTIYDISLRSTRIRTYTNEVVSVPNGVLAYEKVWNFTDPGDEVRVIMDFGVEYGANVEKIKKLALQVISKMDDVMKDPAPKVEFEDMGDFALKFSAKFWVPKWSMANKKKREASEGIYKALTKAKIGIPYPTYSVEMQK